MCQTPPLHKNSKANKWPPTLSSSLHINHKPRVRMCVASTWYLVSSLPASDTGSTGTCNQIAEARCRQRLCMGRRNDHGQICVHPRVRAAEVCESRRKGAGLTCRFSEPPSLAGRGGTDCSASPKGTCSSYGRNGYTLPKQLQNRGKGCIFS